MYGATGSILNTVYGKEIIPIGYIKLKEKKKGEIKD